MTLFINVLSLVYENHMKNVYAVSVEYVDENINKIIIILFLKIC